MNKKGSLSDLYVLVIIAFVMVILFATWIYGFNLISNTLVGIETNNDIVNVSDAASRTFTIVNNSMTGLHFLTFAMIISYILSIFISNYLIQTNPIYFMIYVFITVIAVVFSVYLSNAYEGLLQNDVIGAELLGFSGSTFILLNLPSIVMSVGLISAVILFINIIRDRQQGGEII